MDRRNRSLKSLFFSLAAFIWISIFLHSDAYSGKRASFEDYVFRLQTAGYSVQEIDEILSDPEGLYKVRSRWRLRVAGFSREEAYLLVPRSLPGKTYPGSLGNHPRAVSGARYAASTRLIMKALKPYDQMIKRASVRFNLPKKIIEAVIIAESGGDPKARSSKGAQGLMQLMPETAEEMGVARPYDPYQNIEGGCRYLKKMWDMFKPNWDFALAAYNAGPTRVQAANGIPKIHETEQYVKRVLALADRARKPI